MKHRSLFIILSVAALCVLAGTVLIGWSAAPPIELQSRRPDRRVGDKSPGRLRPRRAATWTPLSDSQGFTVTLTMPHSDRRVARFADFPLVLPSYCPKDSHLEKATLFWDPESQKRVIQVAIRGRYIGLVSEQRLKRPDPTYPVGLYLATVRQSDGGVYRNLQTCVDGVAVSIACSLAVPDDEIIRVYRSLHRVER